MAILAIETSCDETAAAIVDMRGKLLASIVRSQETLHANFGGIVPEIASRAHSAHLLPLLDRTLAQAQLNYRDLRAVAVTSGPGLLGSLLVGVTTAKALSLGLNIPLIGVNHLEAHIAAAFVGKLNDDSEAAEPQFPLLALVVSGGHTVLYLVRRFGELEVIGSTHDDAVGEAFDKVGALLELGYPGGPVIDRLAAAYQGPYLNFPLPMQQSGDWNFSFSGLKTAVMQHVRRLEKISARQQQQIAASFQRAAVGALIGKLEQALAYHQDIRQLVVCGGVACNSELRRSLGQLKNLGTRTLLIPPPAYCTDNAAMIAWLAHKQLQARQLATLDLAPYASGMLLPPHATLRS